MGNTNEARQPIQDRMARKTPIMVVSTRFGEWPLYGLCMKRRSILRLANPSRRATAGGYSSRNLTSARPEIAP